MLSQIVLYLVMLACSLPDVNARETMTLTPIPRTLVKRSVLRNVTRHNVLFGGDILIDVSSTRVLDKLKVGCKKVVMKRYVGSKNRGCRSKKPIKVAKCVGFCLPPWKLAQPFQNFDRVIKKNRYKYRCVPNRYKYKKIMVYCADDGTEVKYRAKIIKNCVCKLYTPQQNEVLTPKEKFLEKKKYNNQQEQAADIGKRNR
ncbi:uncharacterized protein LOC130622118 [Hydractinia symbiolongicarpus]|uniref:uncharacterized protein LOC130622118 n=1 Tax=Hydractinia symbiolongicarpus TaxID=13093 RepID=UPI00254F892D|nr:uncharacterized protein LOC130622118 [Hydractinia symbiolongicarpus]